MGGSSRNRVRFLTASLAGSLSLAAITITAYLYSISDECNIGAPGSSANDWLCLLIWVVGGATILLTLLLALLMTGMLWYRGGVYKFGQLLTLLVPCLAWGTVAVLVTVNGIDANEAAGATNQALRIVLMAITFAAMAVFALATLLRALEKPGRIQQDELDEMEAQKLADETIAHWQRQYGLDACRAWGGINAARAAITQEELARYQREYTSGFRPDNSRPDDILYVPRHPAWYGRWLLPRRVDLSNAPYMPPVLDQGSLSTCTAHAAANAYRFAFVKEARQQQAFMPSRLFIFYNAKHYINGEPIDYKTGLNLRAVFRAVQQYGACEERLFPYEERTLKYSPNKEAYANGQLHRRKLIPIRLFMNNGLDPHTRLYYVMAALARGHPIACGLHIFKPRAERLGRGRGQGVVLNYPSPEELDLKKGPNAKKLWGGHAVLLVGYDRKNRWFKFQNSWGTDWGQRGYFFTGLGYIANPQLSHDFWFFND